MVRADLTIPASKHVYTIGEELCVELRIFNDDDHAVEIECVRDIYPMGFDYIRINPGNLIETERTLMLYRRLCQGELLCIELILKAKQPGSYVWSPVIIYRKGGDEVSCPVATVKLVVEGGPRSRPEWGP